MKSNKRVIIDHFNRKMVGVCGYLSGLAFGGSLISALKEATILAISYVVISIVLFAMSYLAYRWSIIEVVD